MLVKSVAALVLILVMNYAVPAALRILAGWLAVQTINSALRCFSARS
jgi:antibiotic biosynthesis monooxygenase (ABM) superfamily enzyme